MFRYEDKEFTAKSMDHAVTRFLDESWGNHYVKHLETNGLNSKEIYAVEDVEEVQEDGYFKLKQKLENGQLFQIEVWDNDNGSYEGLAQEMEQEEVDD